MNILCLLKSKVGEISKAGLFGLASVGILGGINLYNYVTSSPAAQEQKIRNLASIMTSGGNLPREYSGINVSRGNTEFATAEERAKREGSLFDGGEGAVAALDGLKVGSNGGVEGIGTIEGTALGAGEAGLGMGANKAIEMAGGGRVAQGAQRGDVSGVDGAVKGADKEGSKGPTLQRASIARVGGGSGSASFSGSNGGGFGPSGSASRSVAQEKANRINPSSVGADSISSGAMPRGSTLVAANQNIRGAGSTTFVGGSREGRVRSGSESEEGRDLRRIAVQSGKVAANAHRAANEGASPFMADQQLAAGLTVDDVVTGTSFGGEGDASYSQVGDKQIGDLGEAVDEVDTTEQERKQKRSDLGKELVGLAVATIAAMVAISALMHKDPTPWAKAIAGILAALMFAWIISYIVRAGTFAHNYDNDPVGITFAVLGGIFAVGIALAFVFAEGIYDKILTPVAEGLGMGSAGGLGAMGAGAIPSAIDGLMKGPESGSSDQGSLSNEEKGQDNSQK